MESVKSTPTLFTDVGAEMVTNRPDNRGTRGSVQKLNQISSRGFRAYLCLSGCWPASIDAVTWSSFQINNSDSPFPKGTCVNVCVSIAAYVNTYVNTTHGDKENH